MKTGSEFISRGEVSVSSLLQYALGASWGRLVVTKQAFGKQKDRYLDIVPDEDPSEVKHLQHGGCVVVYDAVAFQDVLGSHDFPGEPAEVKCCIAGQQVGQATWLTAAAASVILVAFHDGFYLSLLAVGAWPETNKMDIRQEVNMKAAI